jgi:hypothetical protein
VNELYFIFYCIFLMKNAKNKYIKIKERNRNG